MLGMSRPEVGACLELAGTSLLGREESSEESSRCWNNFFLNWQSEEFKVA